MSWEPNPAAGGEYYGFVCANPQCQGPLLMGKIDPKDRINGRSTNTVPSGQSYADLSTMRTHSEYQTAKLQRVVAGTKH